MPVNLRAYIVILFISVIAFYFAKKITVPLVSYQQFKSWRNSWLIVTSLAFLSFNFWLFLSLTLMYVALKARKEPNPAALYIALISAVPPINAKIPGFGIVNYFMDVSYLTVLSVGLLLTICFKTTTEYTKLKIGKVKTDVFIILFILLNLTLYLRDTTITDSLRQGTGLFLSTFLPYYVFSRYVQTSHQIKMIFFAFFIVSLPAALVGVFEKSKGWLLYSALAPTLNVDWSFGSYILRDSGLRASSSYGHSIMFGFGIAVALGLYLCIQSYVNNKMYKYIGYGILTAGLISGMARGPWVGAAALIIVFLYLGRNSVSNLMRLGMICLMLLPLLFTFPAGQKVINLLPFVGSVDKFNVEYRQDLIDTSIIVIARSPWFGNKNFDKEPEMQKMYQGEHIIDIVNQYVNVLLNNGYVGLVIFIFIFTSAILNCYFSMKKIKNLNSDLYLIGRTLIAVNVGIIVMIGTVADILIISYIYSVMLGLCVAYTQIVKHELLR